MVFNSVKKKVLGWFIPAEWKGLMQFDFSKLLDLIKGMVTPSEGSKFLLSALGIGGIFYMHKLTIASDFSDGMIGAICVAYYIADTIKKRMMLNGKEKVNGTNNGGGTNGTSVAGSGT